MSQVRLLLKYSHSLSPLCILETCLTSKAWPCWYYEVILIPWDRKNYLSSPKSHYSLFTRYFSIRFLLWVLGIEHRSSAGIGHASNCWSGLHTHAIALFQTTTPMYLPGVSACKPFYMKTNWDGLLLRNWRVSKILKDRHWRWSRLEIPFESLNSLRILCCWFFFFFYFLF